MRAMDILLILFKKLPTQRSVKYGVWVADDVFKMAQTCYNAHFIAYSLSVSTIFQLLIAPHLLDAVKFSLSIISILLFIRLIPFSSFPFPWPKFKFKAKQERSCARF